ncbi:MAG: hypothetical protein ABDH49_01905 [Candidatus Hydrothermales bacterium]
MIFLKLIRGKRTKSIISYYLCGFAIILISPLIDFIFSSKRLPGSIQLSDPLIFSSLSVGAQLEILFFSLLGFLYSISYRRFYKAIITFLFNFFAYLILVLLPFLIIGEKSILAVDYFSFYYQKLSLFYIFLFLFLLVIFFLFFRFHEIKLLKDFLNYDFLFINLFLPFMGFWISFKTFHKDSAIFFESFFNKLIPFLVLVPPLFYSFTKFLFKNKKEIYPFFLILSLVLSFFFSVCHLIFLLLLYAIYFLERLVLRNLKLRPLQISIESGFLFLFGYSVFHFQALYNLPDRPLILFIFVFFLFYGISRYFLMKRKKLQGYLFFLIGIILLPLFGFSSIFYYIIFMLTLIFLGFLYFLSVPSLKSLDLITYFFVISFFLMNVL